MGTFDKMRVWWAGAQYDLWLDLYCVPGKHRRDLRQEFKANLSDAVSRVGAAEALGNVGGLRRLAAETSRDGQLRSRWLAGVVVGMVSFGVVALSFLIASLYYASGALDAGATEPVTTWLFPFLGSSIEVHDLGDSISVAGSPGPMLLLLPLAVFLSVAKPWRSLRRSSSPSEARSS